jgi:hypothetical protein
MKFSPFTGALAVLLLATAPLIHAEGLALPSAPRFARDSVVLSGRIDSGVRVSATILYRATNLLCWELHAASPSFPIPVPGRSRQQRQFVPVIRDGGRYELRIPLHREGGWVSRAYQNLCHFAPRTAEIHVDSTHTLVLDLPSMIEQNPGALRRDYRELRDTRDLQAGTVRVAFPADAFRGEPNLRWDFDFLTEH